ncbi:TRAP transporter small permease [Brachybacterium paraconglomeratum]|uniref:TRAP transporter small permease n=1 Tax=Brachybacterium paraconglomeratum TaxID=173362 RepID=UPI003F7BC8BF
MNALITGLNKVFQVATAILFAVMVLAVVWQVFTREVTQNPSAWTEELAKYLFVWVSLIGAALVFSERGHIAVTFAVERLSRIARKAVAAIIQLIILFFAVGILVVGGVLAAQNSWEQQLTALPGTIGQAYLVLPITGALVAVVALAHLVEDLRGDGPLTADVAQAEEVVPDIPGMGEETALLTEDEHPDSPGGAAGTDRKGE